MKTDRTRNLGRPSVGMAIGSATRSLPFQPDFPSSPAAYWHSLQAPSVHYAEATRVARGKTGSVLTPPSKRLGSKRCKPHSSAFSNLSMELTARAFASLCGQSAYPMAISHHLSGLTKFLTSARPMRWAGLRPSCLMVLIRNICETA